MTTTNLLSDYDCCRSNRFLFDSYCLVLMAVPRKISFVVGSLRRCVLFACFAGCRLCSIGVASRLDWVCLVRCCGACAGQPLIVCSLVLSGFG